ncbi:uncharacterized protein [Watersipora subatra]|uniref:uncharacterized protein n=1 Tax=Watersipora subatra TaxID=2589382 RepID=UPI00355BEAC0
MSSDALRHNNQQQLFHNRYEYDYHMHNGYLDSRPDATHQVLDCHHRDEELDRQNDAIIRGNMQYINGELRKIPRPLNAFMIFSNEKRKELKKEFPGEPNNMISSRHSARGVQALNNPRRRVEASKQSTSAATSKPSDTSGASNIKQEDGSEVPPVTRQSPSTSRQISTNSTAHGLPTGVVSAATMSGPFTEGWYTSNSTGYLAPEVSTECMLSCCNGCKHTDIYCCPESHWSSESVTGPLSFTSGPYPPPMFYFTPGCEPQFSPDAIPSQSCLMSGDCSACYPAASYIDGCYGPLYPAAGDASMCFMPEMPSTTSPPLIVTSAGSVTSPLSDGDTELTDISNSMVPSSCSQDSQVSSHDSSASKGSSSPSSSTLQEVSPPSSMSVVDVVDAPSAHDM